MAAADAEPRVGLSEGRRILLVEDDAAVGETLAAVLRRHGHQATLVTSVALALQRLREETYDAVVSDLLLDDEEGRTGFAVLAEAKRSHPAVVAILITGYPSDAAVRRAAEEGVDGLLAKPLQIEDLLVLLERKAAPAG